LTSEDRIDWTVCEGKLELEPLELLVREICLMRQHLRILGNIKTMGLQVNDRHLAK
jgi:hypothetical protein